MSKLFVFLLRNKNCKNVKSLPRVTSPCKAVAGIRSHLVYPETDQFPFWYKLFVESSQPAPNQYRKADDSSLLCVEMRLCNLAMNRLKGFYFTTYTNLKILGQSAGCFYVIWQFSMITCTFWHQTDSLNLSCVNWNLISIFRRIDCSAWMSQEDYTIVKLIHKRKAQYQQTLKKMLRPYQ